MILKTGFFVLLIFVVLSVTLGNVPATRSSKRLNLRFLGIGPRCATCPEHFCDDDPAIVHGFCCGCAGFFDNLPVKCAPTLKCPLNTYELCEDYEYMMNCCCNK